MPKASCSGYFTPIPVSIKLFASLQSEQDHAAELNSQIFVHAEPKETAAE